MVTRNKLLTHSGTNVPFKLELIENVIKASSRDSTNGKTQCQYYYGIYLRELTAECDQLLIIHDDFTRFVRHTL